jgi:hypothetical protein
VGASKKKQAQDDRTRQFGRPFGDCAIVQGWPGTIQPRNRFRAWGLSFRRAGIGSETVAAPVMLHKVYGLLRCVSVRGAGWLADVDAMEGERRCVS